MGDVIIKGSVGLHLKMYSYQVDDDEEQKVKEFKNMCN